MARDDTARDYETERSLLDRCSHLTLAGATAASLAATDVAAPAGLSSNATVPAGETSENELIDATTDAAVVEVHDVLQ